jgi:hypothetical protein
MSVNWSKDIDQTLAAAKEQSPLHRITLLISVEIRSCK